MEQWLCPIPSAAFAYSGGSRVHSYLGVSLIELAGTYLCINIGLICQEVKHLYLHDFFQI